MVAPQGPWSGTREAVILGNGSVDRQLFSVEFRVTVQGRI